MKFICYNYLPVLADYIIDLPLVNYSNAGTRPLHNYSYLNSSTLKDGDKIFVKTDLLNYFFNMIFPSITTKFYLITGVSDYEIDDTYLSQLNNDKIIKWIGVNISIQKHPKICKMLIGFQEPDRIPGGDQELLYEMYNSKKKFNDKLDKLFISYFENTHSSRHAISNIFIDSTFVDFGEKIDFKNYLNKINDYKFVLCPRGNGLDTHRFCEILLMGSIPIIEKNGLVDLYEKFPCIIVQSFNDINYKLLQEYTFDVEKYKVFENYVLVDKINININF
jgi:hypothetical protein